MNAAPPRRAAPGGLALAVALCFVGAAAGESGVAGAPRALAVEAPAFAWSGRTVDFDVVQQDRLSGRRLTVLVFLDDRLAATHATNGSRTRIELTPDALAPGMHVLRVKSGTFEATDRFRVLSLANVTLWATAAAAAIALLFGAARTARRKQRLNTNV